MRNACWLLLLLLPWGAAAQSAVDDSPVALVRHFGHDWLSDQRFIWTRPLHVTRKQAKALIPFAAVTAALIATDRHSSAALPNTPAQVHAASTLSNAGAGAFGALGAGLFAFGRVAKDDRAAEAGFLGGEAAASAFAVVEVLKLATARQRPTQEQGHGRFWADGDSFPSGHSIFAWSVAEVVASEYRDRPLARIGAYSLAAVVSLSRFPARKHFLSDVVAGSAGGFLIGRHVWQSHHPDGRRRLGAPVASVRVDPRSHGYAVTLVWQLR